ncbi:MAG: tRNA-intron lyase [Candidatus Woesearchaeota archaeon]
MKQAQAQFQKKEIIAVDCDAARQLHQSGFGVKGPKGSVFFSLVESLYLMEKGKLSVRSKRKDYEFDDLFVKLRRKELYVVYKKLRDAGHKVHSGLKFGGDFRVYEKGSVVGKDHAKWIVHAVNDSQRFTWKEFAALARVAHSTRKHVLFGVVDSEYDVTFFDVDWKRVS